MKFEDLQFNPHRSSPLFNVHCRVELPNGNGISIVNGDCAYCDFDTYEIAPLRNGELFYVDSWGDQVKGYVTKSQINEILYHMENDTPEEYKDFLETLR